MLRWDLTEMEIICVGLFFPLNFLVIHYTTSSSPLILLHHARTSTL